MKPRDLRRAMLVSVPSEPMQKIEEAFAVLESAKNARATMLALAATMKLASLAPDRSDRIEFDMTADDGAVTHVEVHVDEDETAALITRLVYRAMQRAGAEASGR